VNGGRPLTAKVEYHYGQLSMALLVFSVSGHDTAEVPYLITSWVPWKCSATIYSINKRCVWPSRTGSVCFATIVFHFLQNIIPSFMSDARSIYCVMFYRKYVSWMLPLVCRYSATWFHNWDDHVYQSTGTQSPIHSYGVGATTLWAICFCLDTWIQKRYTAHG